MIDWWGLAHNSMWVVGLALALAVLSVARYQAARDGARLGAPLSAPAPQALLNLALTLFCLGLLFSADALWERVLWAALASLAAGQAGWLAWKLWAAARARARTRVRLSPARRRLGWGLLLAGLLLLTAWGAVTAVQLLDHARSLQDHLDHLNALATRRPAALNRQDLAGASHHLSAARADLAAMDARVGPLLPLGRLLAWAPRHGGDLAAASDLLDLASGVAAAAADTLQALAPAFDPAAPGANLGPPAAESILPLLIAAAPQLEAARSKLASARAARARVRAADLSPRLADLLARLDRLLPTFGAALDAGLLAPALLGAAGPRTCLILAQNNDELRATGGFISGVGELRVEDGRIVSLHFADSYAVDNLAVPHDLTPTAFRQTLFGELWFFRDANWDADFPTSARRALALYARDRGVEADGVVALDLVALRLLVDAVGPLQVEGARVPVTGANVVQVLRQQWAEPAAGPALAGGASGEWWRHRKDFMGDVAAAALDRLQGAEGLDPASLASALKRALDEKHLLVYLADPEAAALLHDQNWDGATPDPFSGQDLLLVVDSNVGFNKADARVARAIDYRVDLAPADGPQARVTVTYRHQARRPAGACLQESRYGETYADLTERCYWDYLRVYVPALSELLEAPELPLPEGSLLGRAGATETVTSTLTENGLAVWATFFPLEPAAERTLTFAYRLPAWVLDYDQDGAVVYRLRVQKQPGTEAVPFCLEVAPPEGMELAAWDPPALDLAGRACTDLRVDRGFELAFRRVGGQR